jgi:hypothetical protein
VVSSTIAIALRFVPVISAHPFQIATGIGVSPLASSTRNSSTDVEDAVDETPKRIRLAGV